MKDVRRSTNKPQYSTSFGENNINNPFSSLPKTQTELRYFTQEDMNALEVFLSGENIDTSKFVNSANGKESGNYISAVIEAICRNQLATLKQWAHILDSLPRIKQDAIWKTCCVLPAFSNYNRSSFTLTISAWDANPVRNMSSIAVLYSAIVFLHQEQLLPEIPYKQTNLPSSPILSLISNPNTISPNSNSNTNSSSSHFQVPTSPKTPATIQPPRAYHPSLVPKNNHVPPPLPSPPSLNFSQQVPQINQRQQVLYRSNSDHYSQHKQQPQQQPQQQQQQRPPPGVKVDANKQQLTVCSGCNQWLRFPIGAEIIRCPKCNNIIMNHLNQARDKTATFTPVSQRSPSPYSSQPQPSRSPPIGNNLKTSKKFKGQFNLPSMKSNHSALIFPGPPPVSPGQANKPVVYLPPPTSKIPLITPSMQGRSPEPMGMTKHQLDLPLDKKVDSENNSLFRETDWRILSPNPSSSPHSLSFPPKQPMQKVVILLDKDDSPPPSVPLKPPQQDIVMKDVETQPIKLQNPSSSSDTQER